MRKSPINVAIFVFIYFPKALMPGCKRSGINVFYLLIIFSGIILPHFSYVSFAVMLRINISHKHSVCIIAALPHLTVAFTHLHNNTFSESLRNIDIILVKAGDYRNVTVTADKIIFRFALPPRQAIHALRNQNIHRHSREYPLRRHRPAEHRRYTGTTKQIRNRSCRLHISHPE